MAGTFNGKVRENIITVVEFEHKRVINLLIDLFFSLSKYLKFNIVHFVSINHCLCSSFSLSIEMKSHRDDNIRK